ncbi:MAG TPA: DUF4850 domain-containing protein, partial [Bacilli bacterium]
MPIRYGSLLLTFLLIAVFTASCARSAEKPARSKTPHPGRPVASPAVTPLPQATNAQESGKQPKQADCGVFALAVNANKTVKIPLTCIEPHVSLEHHKPTAQAPPDTDKAFRFALPDEKADSFQAFWISPSPAQDAGVLLLAPKGWKPAEANMGADGSMKISI